MKRILLAATAFYALAAFLLPLSVNAQGQQYLWDFVSQEVRQFGPSERIDIDNAVTGTRQYILMYGKYSRTDGAWTTIYCQSQICALGVFVYQKNPSIGLDTGQGLNFSPTVYLEMDSRPMTAFAQSSIAFYAGVSGFMAEPIVKGLATALIALTMVPMIFASTWKMIQATKGAKQEINENTSNVDNSGDTDSGMGAE